MQSRPQYLDVPLAKYLDDEAQRSPSARRLWWLIVGLALLAIFLTGLL